MVEMTKREVYLWEQANRETGGRFTNKLQKTISKLQRQERKMRSLVQEVNASPAAVRPKLPGRPWDRGQSAVDTLFARHAGGGLPHRPWDEAEPGLRLRGGVSTRASLRLRG